MKDMELFSISSEEKLNGVNLDEVERTIYYISLLGMDKKELLVAIKENPYEFSFSDFEPLLDFKTHVREPFTQPEKTTLKNMKLVK